jgi:drug/metabolite transporter (DMT)-like permease
MNKKPAYPLALVEAIVVNFIWASSFIVVKIALKDLGPLTIAGFRYFLAFLLLLPFMLRNGKISISRGMWGRLFLIGICAYTIGNGAMFWSLRYLPATTVSFMLGMIVLMVLFAGIFWLREIPSRLQTIGIVITISGTVMFFSIGFRPGEPLGLAILFIGMVGFSIFGILGREIAREQKLDTLTLTGIPLALGGGLLLVAAIPLEGLPRASLLTWGLVLWLALINTALAYILYNHSLQVLTAFEMNTLLNLGPIWTAIMSWFLLSEHLTVFQICGILVVIGGVMLVQRRPYEGEARRLAT